MESLGSATPSSLNFFSHFCKTVAIVLLLLMPGVPDWADDDKAADNRRFAKFLVKSKDRAGTRDEIDLSINPMHGSKNGLKVNAMVKI